jgi:hypothetical protein
MLGAVVVVYTVPRCTGTATSESGGRAGSRSHAFQLMFYASARIALVGAIACFILVRRGDRVAEGPIFGRRSR